MPGGAGRPRAPSFPRSQGLLACLLIVAALGGCHRDMWDQPRYKPLAKSTFFEDGLGSRGQVAGTVAYGNPRLDDHFYRGKVDNEFAATLPEGMELNRILLERGRERFEIFCMPCHGPQGNGGGMVALRGFPPPPTYHQDRLREVPVGYFFDVMTRGFGRMYPYATRVPPEDRWAIAAYIRALQLSRSATEDLLPEGVLQQARSAESATIETEPETDAEH